MLPAPLIAARREGVPAAVYAAEIHHAPEGREPRPPSGGHGPDRAHGPRGHRGHRLVVHGRGAVPGLGAGEGDSHVSADRREPRRRRRWGFRRRHGIAPRRAVHPRGRQPDPRTGQDVLLRSLPSIRSEVEGTRLVLVGPTFDRPKDIAFEAELRALATALGISPAVTFAGYERDMAGAYAAAAVVVNPSRTHPESFGMAACEALVAGRPVVATRVGAVPRGARWHPRRRVGPARRPGPACGSSGLGAQGCRRVSPRSRGRQGDRRALSAAAKPGDVSAGYREDGADPRERSDE